MSLFCIDSSFSKFISGSKAGIKRRIAGTKSLKELTNFSNEQIYTETNIFSGDESFCSLLEFSVLQRPFSTVRWRWNPVPGQSQLHDGRSVQPRRRWKVATSREKLPSPAAEKRIGENSRVECRPNQFGALATNDEMTDSILRQFALLFLFANCTIFTYNLFHSFVDNTLSVKLRIFISL